MKNYSELIFLLGVTACGLEPEVGQVNASSGSAGTGGMTTTSSVDGGNGGNDGVGGANAGGEATGGFGGSAGSGGSDFGGNNSGGSYTGGSSNQGGAGGSEDCGNLLGKFVTYSQGGWHNNKTELISKVIGNGMLIGKADADYASFTNADAVVAFLPAGGTPDALQGRYTNPLTTPAGVLAGQTLALKLNAAASGEACGYMLGDLVMVDGDCEGMSVSEVLESADRALAGEEISLSYSNLNKCAEGINLNFHNGAVDNQYLKLP